MAALGIIGGSGLSRIESLSVDKRELVDTPYGEPSSPLLFGRLNGLEVAFLPRHGGNHQVPPHKVNYQANIWAFSEVGVRKIIGMAAVGGISDRMGPGVLCVPDQIIDYTYGRNQTFYEQDLRSVMHIDFTEPYCAELRNALIETSLRIGVSIVDHGTYGATQGPRLETAAEIRRMARDGCDIVGMTGMPEAALAKELNLCYANFSLVVNWAAGLGDGGPISMKEIDKHLQQGMSRAVEVVSAIDSL